MEQNKLSVSEKPDGMDDNRKMHQMLEQAYGREKVPADVKLRLENRLACKEVMKEQSISFWWLPALLSTLIALSGFTISAVLYLIISVKSPDFIMPNLMHLISTGWMHIISLVTICQIGVSWIFTVIGLFKLNFRKRAHIL